MSSPETILDSDDNGGPLKVSEMKSEGYTNKELLHLQKAFDIMARRARLNAEKAMQGALEVAPPAAAAPPQPTPKGKETTRGKYKKGGRGGKGRAPPKKK